MIAVEVDGDSVEGVAAQIPAASSLEPGTEVVVRPKARGIFSKLLASATPLPVMGSALLARGYVAIRAAAPDGRPGLTALSEAT